jgi:hypothetical protein
MARYTIRGRVEGKKRLDVLARVMWPTTDRVLNEAGLTPGMTCLNHLTIILAWVYRYSDTCLGAG